MADPEDEARLKALGQRIRAAKGTGPETPHVEDHYSQAHLAWRMVIELVAGLGIGLGIGYGLDAVFGTRPFLMVLFILLGFAAGVRTMMRTAREAQDIAQRQAAEAAQNEEG